MNWLRDCPAAVEENVPLAPRTWFRLGGPARWLVHPYTHQALGEVLRRCAEQGLPVRLLGSGANLLVDDDGVDGVVVRLDAPDFRGVRIEGTTVRAGAGFSLPRLVRRTVDHGLGGLEGLAGIPGSVGGAVWMNAGGRFGQIGDVVTRVGVVDAAGRCHVLSRDDVGFAYRTTRLKGFIICWVELALSRGEPQRLRQRMREIMAYKASTQPLAAHSAGCIFRNPPGASAGALIEQAGLKGCRRGGACVSPAHANFLVADARARAADVIALLRHVQRCVFERLGVWLEPEVVIWSRNSPAEAQVAPPVPVAT